MIRHLWLGGLLITKTLQHNLQQYNAYTGNNTLFKETIYCPIVKFIVKLPPKFIPGAPDTIAFLEATSSALSLAVPKLKTDSSFFCVSKD